ncbi:MAG: hypothetical protein KC503_20020 [Myxococcales bacterium]|nr:hypothetical protein [Myxococcales bacterium]
MPRALLALLCASAAACSDPVTTVADPSCGEGVGWQGSHAEVAPEGKLASGGDHVASELMHPGRECLKCHQANRRAPVLLVAGTIYRIADERSDCAGAAGATVLVIDDNGVRYERTTNATGNFFIRQSDAPDFAMPYRTEVTFGAKTYSMYPSTDNGDCNTCHTPSGAQKAVGRACVDENDVRCTH